MKVSETAVWILVCVMLVQAQLGAEPVAVVLNPVVIANHPEAYTHANYEQDVAVPFYRRTLLEAYKKHGVRDPKWDDAALSFFEKMVPTMAGSPQAISIDEAHRLAIELEQRFQCTDPLVRYFRWYYELAEYGWSWPEKVLPIAEQLEAAGYPPSWVARAYALKFEVISRWQRNPEAEAKKVQAIRRSLHLWRQSLVDPHNRGATQQEIYELMRHSLHFLGNMLNPYLDECVNVFEGFCHDKQVDPWTAHLLAGMIHIDAGWAIRGDGWAHEVKPEAWEPFGKHLDVADMHLREAYRLRPEYPQAAQRMITVAAAGHDATQAGMVTWFERSIKARIDYVAAYKSMTNFLRPRWGGSLPALIQAGTACADTERYDTVVPMLLAHFMKTVSEEMSFQWDPLRRMGLAQRVVDITEKMLQEKYWQGARHSIQTVRAAFAVKAENYPAAYDALMALGDERLGSTASLAHGWPQMLERVIPARGGPAGTIVLHGDTAFKRRDYNEADKLYRQASKQLPDTHAGQRYLRDQLQAIVWEQAFETGQWVDLSIAPNLAGWTVINGDWQYEPHHVLKGRVRKANQKIVILNAARFGHRFEYEADVTIDEGNQYSLAAAGVIFAWARTPVCRFRSVVLLPNCNAMGVRRDFVIGEMFHAELPKMLHIRVVVFDKRVTVYINGRQLYDDQWLKPDEQFGDDEYVGFGDYQQSRQSKFFRISNVRIRRLDAMP
ncbi:hypothetical protein HED60_04105 [Planctomycetales bacterium ZRK34]|nr:hypothetical protein HED60_04105 [Planctomycetales bacterium ZRK34]